MTEVSTSMQAAFSSGLDHAGIFAHSLDEIAAQYERLGFLLTPFSQHSSTDPQTGVVVQRGTANRCAMLGQGYIELLAIVDPSLDVRGLDLGLGHHVGLHILALGCAQPEQSLAALKDRGFTPRLADLRRTLDTPEGPRQVVFTQVRVPPAEMPEGMVFLLRHETPQWMWQQRYLSHPNGAQALTGVVVQVADVGAVAQRYARFLGLAPQRHGAGYRLDLPQGRFTLMPADAMPPGWPSTQAPALPFPAAISVGVADLAQTAGVLKANAVPYDNSEAGLIVPREHAGGLAVHFHTNCNDNA